MDRLELILALEAAAAAHHEYEEMALGGERDELWAGFYAAYVLGRLGNFMTPTALARVLEAVEGDPWPEAAADDIIVELSS
jgi:prolipoprotein diacylglyceryltransferase